MNGNALAKYRRPLLFAATVLVAVASFFCWRAVEDVSCEMSIAQSQRAFFAPRLIRVDAVQTLSGLLLAVAAAAIALRTRSQQTKQKWDRTFDAVPDPITVLDKHHCILHANKAMAAKLGKTPEECVGLICYRVVHGLDAPPDFCPHKQLLEDGKPHCNEVCAKRLGGHFEVNTTPLCTVDGYLIGSVHVAHDITERKQAETALQISEAKYKALFDSSADAIAVFSAAPNWLSGNPAAIKLFGCRDEAEFLAHNAVSLSPEFQPDGIPSATKAQQMMEIVSREGSYSFEWKFRRVNGTDFLAAVTINKTEFGGETIFQGTFRDITEQKQIEQALVREALRYYAIMEASLEGIYIIDAEGNLKECNASFLRSMGYSREESQHLHASDWNAEWNRSEALEAVQSRMKTGRTYQTLHRRKDGSLMDVEVNTTSVVLDGKSLLFNSVRDISQRKQTEEELRMYTLALESANKALEESNRLAESAVRAKSQFLANMCHEIRTPMTAILGYADILINEPGLEKAPKQRRLNLETIKRNGIHLLEVINDILDVSKVEAGKLQIEPVSCSPFELIAEVVSLMQVRADEKQLALVTDLSGQLPETASIDPLRTRQVLVNLVGNAIKFTDRGEVRIRAQLTEEGDRPQLRFDVIDTGVGMDEEQVGKLFQAFTQVDNSAARKFGGTGLGLCICKRLSEAMGGCIEVQSTPGVGSVFSFTIDPGPLDGIPRIRNGHLPESEKVMTTATANKIALPHRILLAEDGPDNQRLIRTILEDVGAEVTTVENGRFAVDAALAAQRSGRPFKVILMDMQMPVTDGYAATRELRARGYAAPIIALTAHAMTDDRQKCIEAGCDDFVTKPIDWQKMYAAVDYWSAHASSFSIAAFQEEVAGEEGGETEEPLFSSYADNPVIAKILPEFVHCLDARLQAMNAALAEGNLEELRRLAHQLKGAGGSYGYPTITEAAKALEFHARDDRKEESQASLKTVAALCRAAVQGFMVHQD